MINDRHIEGLTAKFASQRAAVFPEEGGLRGQQSDFFTDYKTTLWLEMSIMNFVNALNHSSGDFFNRRGTFYVIITGLTKTTHFLCSDGSSSVLLKMLGIIRDWIKMSAVLSIDFLSKMKSYFITFFYFILCDLKTKKNDNKNLTIFILSLYNQEFYLICSGYSQTKYNRSNQRQ